MKFSELEIGKLYRNDNYSVFYKVIYIAEKYGVIIYYESNHHIATLQFIDAYGDGCSEWIKVDEDDIDFNYINMVINTMHYKYNDTIKQY